MEEKARFTSIADRLITEYPDHIAHGKMMHAPAITWQGKVFAFFSKDQCMVFKLGKDFDPEAHRVPGLLPFNPFRKKGPLPGWFSAPFSESDEWESLALEALSHLSTP